MPSMVVCKNLGEGGRHRERDGKLCQYKTNVEDKNISTRGTHYTRGKTYLNWLNDNMWRCFCKSVDV